MRGLLIHALGAINVADTEIKKDTPMLQPISPEEPNPIPPTEPGPQEPPKPKRPKGPLFPPSEPKPKPPVRPVTPITPTEPKEPKQPKPVLPQVPKMTELEELFRKLKNINKSIKENKDRFHSSVMDFEKRMVLQKIIELLNKKDLYFIISTLYLKYKNNYLTEDSVLEIWSNISKTDLETLKKKIQGDKNLSNFLMRLQFRLLLSEAKKIQINEQSNTSKKQKTVGPKLLQKKNKTLMYAGLMVLTAYLLKRNKKNKR